MKIQIIAVSIIILLTSCAKDNLVDLSNDDNLNKVIESQIRQYSIPGIAYCSVIEDSVIFSGAKGLANIEENREFTLDTRMVIGSVSKTIAVTAIMQLYEQGLVSLDDNINKFLPFAVVNPNYPNDEITIKMMLTHSSSITDNGWYYSTFALFGYVDYPQPLGEFVFDYLVKGRQYYTKHNYENIKPGSKYIYSNVAIGLLAHIIEQISGTDYNTYCKKYIFEPMGMNKTTWFYSETPRDEVAVPYINTSDESPKNPFSTYPDYPNGHLITTINDLSILLRTYIMNGSYKGVQLLKPESVALILQNYIDSEFEQQGLIFYANIIDNQMVWGHTGGDPGATSHFYFNKESKVGYVYFYNKSIDNVLIVGEALLNYTTQKLITQ